MHSDKSLLLHLYEELEEAKKDAKKLKNFEKEIKEMFSVQYEDLYVRYINEMEVTDIEEINIIKAVFDYLKQNA